ncbi:hypothetical protein GCM10010399_39610 [Dactylosporangium fulvum]|uniref:FHA domain-containing protein n=1 Tax=Dactylosporangium fulvum TaxID=53359 RepID=A0ABY5WED2_9ACTN|nr:hypothetical protein [Dactylosporangium fulvum]UWP87783.1 hypothetical protein Dfulv_01245 [Dactylosporangium fulvum]
MSVTPARGRQLSLFGVEARPPAPLDLEGLLLGAGQVGRMGGTGRVSVVVEDAWRCAVLQAECGLRDLVVTCEPAGEDDRWLVRTAYSSALAPLAADWLDDDGDKRCPAELALDGRRLRLWVAAAGRYDGQRTYLLRLAPTPRLPEPPPAEEGEVEEEKPEEEAPAADLPAADPGEPEVAAAPEHDTRAAANGRAERARVRTADQKPNKRRKKSESQVSAFDPGPDEYADFDAFDGPDEYAELDPFVDETRDDWPDSGLADLPAVALDPVTDPAAEPESPEIAPEAKQPAENPAEDVVIDRRVADNWLAVGEALAAVGLPAVFVAPDQGGPAYRIVGPRRIARLAELVGEAPPEAPVGAWPG